MKYTIDAKNKSLGRVAGEVAVILIGKNLPDYVPNKVANAKVVVENVKEIKITGKKLKQKEYLRYSGYPGGLKKLKMEQVVEKKENKRLFELAVRGMLPKNKLRPLMMKNLTIKQ
jgi:large subunit ribosomal protein L13